MIKDKLLFSSDSSFLYKKCFSCSKNSHLLYKCPLLNPLIMRTHLVNKITASKPQVREIFLRKNHSKFNARKKISSLQKNQILYFLNRTTSEDSLSKLSKRSSDSNGKGQFLKHEKSGKLSIISEKDDENSSDFSYENILSTKKKSLTQTNEKLMNIKSNEDDDSDDLIEEEKINNFITEKKFDDEENNDYDALKIFKNYQPHFNYNAVFTTLNKKNYNESCQDSIATSKKEKKSKKYKIKSKKLFEKINKK